MTLKPRDSHNVGKSAEAAPRQFPRNGRAWLAAWALTALQSIVPMTAFASLVVPNDGSDAVLSDSRATIETNNLYNVIKSRTTQANSNMIEGQHLGGPSDLDGGAPAFDINTYRIDSRTSLKHAYPRMVGARYDANNSAGDYTLDSTTIGQINQHLIELSTDYHPMISITATPRNPWAQAAGRTSTSADGTLAELDIGNRGVPGSAAQKFWNDIDTIADGLGQLKMPDGTPIPVVFRPFAEVNTDKYYFRGQDSAQFVKLWKQVAKYYVETRNVHNLIFCWEAWVWHRSPDRTPSEVDIAPWFPVASTVYPLPYVDIVAGSFYFEKSDLPYFSLNLPDGPDKTVFYSLMNLAVSHDKPFGASQWAVNFKYDSPDSKACVYGDNRNTLQFMSSVDNQHFASASTPNNPVQHMAFAYYWGDNRACMDVQNQDNASEFVDDPRIASITGLDAVNTEGGWIRESVAGSGKGGDYSAGTPLRTGDSAGSSGCKNCQYKSIVSFDTSSQVLPNGAIVGPGPATLLLTKSATVGASPFSKVFGPLWIDAASKYFGTSRSFDRDDFELTAADHAHVATMTDPITSSTGLLSFGALPTQYINRQGRTQLRIGFQAATDYNNTNNYIDWNLGTGNAPELILTYTLPNP